MPKSLAALMLFLPMATWADGPIFLDKDQVHSALSGKAFLFKRGESVVRWQFDASGHLFGNNRSNGQRDSAKWTVQSDGSVCLIWQGRSKNSCNDYFMQDNTLMRSLGRDAEAVQKAVALTPD